MKSIKSILAAMPKTLAAIVKSIDENPVIAAGSFHTGALLGSYTKYCRHFSIAPSWEAKENYTEAYNQAAELIADLRGNDLARAHGCRVTGSGMVNHSTKDSAFGEYILAKRLAHANNVAKRIRKGEFKNADFGAPKYGKKEKGKAQKQVGWAYTAVVVNAACKALEIPTKGLKVDEKVDAIAKLSKANKAAKAA